jgi:hypothetical protein
LERQTSIKISTQCKLGELIFPLAGEMPPDAWNGGFFAIWFGFAPGLTGKRWGGEFPTVVEERSG